MLREKAGYKSAEKFASKYDMEFSDGDRSVFSSYRDFENSGKKSNPTASVLCNLADLLDCDIDYLLGRHDVISSETDFIMEKTGLSEISVNHLRRIHNDVQSDKEYNLPSRPALEIIALNALLENPEIGNQILRLIGSYLQYNYDEFSVPHSIIKGTTTYSDNIAVDRVFLGSKAKSKRSIPFLVTVEDVRASLLVQIQNRLNDLRRHFQSVCDKKNTASGAGNTGSGQQEQS